MFDVAVFNHLMLQPLIPHGTSEKYWIQKETADKPGLDFVPDTVQ